MDYGRPIEFGLSVVPSAGELDAIRAAVTTADRSGLDLVGIQDHPYQWRFLDTWMLMASLLAQTERIRLFADVTNLPLRPPAVTSPLDTGCPKQPRQTSASQRRRARRVRCTSG